MSVSLKNGGNTVILSDETRAENRRRADELSYDIAGALRQFTREAIDFRRAQGEKAWRFDQVFCAINYFMETRTELWNQEELASLFYSRTYSKPFSTASKEQKTSFHWLAEAAMKLGETLKQAPHPVYETLRGIITTDQISNAICDCLNARSMCEQIVLDPDVSFEQALAREAKQRRFVMQPWTHYQSRMGQGWDAEQAAHDTALARRVMFHNRVFLLEDIFPAKERHLEYEQLFSVGMHSGKLPTKHPMRFGFVTIEKEYSDGPAIHVASIYLFQPELLRALKRDKSGLGQAIIDDICLLGTEENHDDGHQSVYGIMDHNVRKRPFIPYFVVPSAPAYQPERAVAWKDWTARMILTKHKISPLEHYAQQTHRDRMEEAAIETPQYRHTKITRCCRFLANVKALREQGGIDYAMSDELANFYLRRLFNEMYPGDPVLAPVRDAIDDLLPQARKTLPIKAFEFLCESGMIEHHNMPTQIILRRIREDDSYLKQMNRRRNAANELGAYIRKQKLFKPKSISKLTRDDAIRYMETFHLLETVENETRSVARQLHEIHGYLLDPEKPVDHALATAMQKSGLDLADPNLRQRIALTLKDMPAFSLECDERLSGQLRYLNSIIQDEFFDNLTAPVVEELLKQAFAAGPSPTMEPHLSNLYTFLERNLNHDDGIAKTLSGYDAVWMRVALSGFYDMLHFEEIPLMPTHAMANDRMPTYPAWQITEQFADAFAPASHRIGVSEVENREHHRATGIRVKAREADITEKLEACALPFFYQPLHGNGFVAELRQRVTSETDRAVCDAMQKKVEGCYRAIRSRHPNAARFRSTDDLQPVIDAFRNLLTRECAGQQQAEALSRLECFEKNAPSATGKARESKIAIC